MFLEGFPDRGYTDGGRLVPRDQAGALVTEEADMRRNAVALAASTDPCVDSVCVHGDARRGRARIAVRRALEAAGHRLVAFSTR